MSNFGSLGPKAIGAVVEGLRLVIANDLDRAMEQSAKRDETIAKLEAQAAQWVGKLDAQDAGLR